MRYCGILLLFTVNYRKKTSTWSIGDYTILQASEKEIHSKMLVGKKYSLTFVHLGIFLRV